MGKGNGKTERGPNTVQKYISSVFLDVAQHGKCLFRGMLVPLPFVLFVWEQGGEWNFNLTWVRVEARKNEENWRKRGSKKCKTLSEKANGVLYFPKLCEASYSISAHPFLTPFTQHTLYIFLTSIRICQMTKILVLVPYEAGFFHYADCVVL